jgi:type II secretory pathway component PulK
MKRRGEEGVALLIVLGVIALLSTLVIGLEAEVSRNLALVGQARGTAAARRTAEVGLAAAMVLLQYDREEDDRNRQPVDFHFRIDTDDGLAALQSLAGLRELWSLFAPGGMSPLQAMGLPGNFLPLGESGGVEVTIEDQSGRWNVHRLLRPAGIKMDDREVKAALQAMTLLLEDGDLARMVTAALIDWLDSDDDNVDPSGAESFFYRTLEPSYDARNGPIPHIDELRALRGVDEDTYALLVSAVTVWPWDLPLYSAYKINVNTATPEALMFAEERLDWATAERIIEERDRAPFERIGDLQKFVVDDLGLKAVWGSILERDIFTVQSRAFRVRATGYADEGATVAILEAVVDRDPIAGRMRVIQRRWLTL